MVKAVTANIDLEQVVNPALLRARDNEPADSDLKA